MEVTRCLRSGAAEEYPRFVELLSNKQPDHSDKRGTHMRAVVIEHFGPDLDSLGFKEML